MRALHLASLCGLILFTAACTQDPAEVSYKGDEFYGKVHEVALDNPNHETYPENSPRIKPEYSHSAPPAKMQTVAISDLPPPTPAAQPQTQPISQPQPQSQQVASLAAKPAQSPYANAKPAQVQGKVQFIWPVEDGKIISHFGPKSAGRSNDGINVSVAEGEPIWAAAGGTVVYAGNDLKGYGNMIIIRHGGGWMTAYAHARSIAVKKDATVKQGDIIGYIGMTGGVQAPQLHFAIRDGRTPVDPELYLPKRG